MGQTGRTLQQERIKEFQRALTSCNPYTTSAVAEHVMLVLGHGLVSCRFSHQGASYKSSHHILICLIALPLSAGRIVSSLLKFLIALSSFCDKLLEGGLALCNMPTMLVLAS